MTAVRLVVFADLHLGTKKAPGLRWAYEALSEATRRSPDVVVFAGDLLDKKKAVEADLADGVALFRHITEDLNLPLVHVWGNHDVGSGLLPRFPDLPGVHRPSGEGIEEIRVPGIPLVFHAVNVIRDPDPRDLLENLPRVEEPGHIGILHSEVEGQYTKNPCLPTTLEHLLSRGYGACLLGHVHTPVVLNEDPWIGWVGMGKMLELQVPPLP
ncbi:metallophosphoesterase family protein [Corynebacterium comes]|uniref:Calcineurin-like phosphoesterase superfamily domain protein n=1 Tax=Corynebacterium comes TaxID=2675218 RepID=A0A6B8VGM5_9CORY|nr:metallophosphoesterase [Corynebacterium comes]QGU03303.1 Calcineurin-like phosphoesterase superfamily domain protein [Corynebacterium comes]